MLSTVNAAILGIADGRAVRQIPIDPSTQPLLARARDGLWITSADALLRHNRITRIDPDTGNITAMLDSAASGQTRWSQPTTPSVSSPPRARSC